MQERRRSWHRMGLVRPGAVEMRARCRHVMSSLVALLGIWALPAVAQLAGKPLAMVEGRGVRIVWPEDAPPESSVPDRLLQAYYTQRPLPGLPPDILGRQTLTISLASQLNDDLDGWAWPIQHLIVLPRERVPRWSESKLLHVLRHELAHVELGLFLQVSVPDWFGEGFSEWAAGGLTCEGEARLRLHLLSDSSKTALRARLFDGPTMERSRLSYDYIATFFTFVDKIGRGRLSNGEVLREIKETGVRSGLRRALESSLDNLIDDWWTWLVAQYRVWPDDFTCAPPASPSFKTAKICASVNRVFRMPSPASVGAPESPLSTVYAKGELTDLPHPGP